MRAIILLVSTLLLALSSGEVHMFKFRKEAQVQGPPPPPPPPQQQELIDDSRLLAPLIYAPAPLLPAYQPLPPPPAEHLREQPPRPVPGTTKGGSVQLEATKSAPPPQPAYQPAVVGQQTVAYLVVKPLSKFQNYYDPALAAYVQQQQQQQRFLPPPPPQVPALRPIQLETYPIAQPPRQQNLEAVKGGQIQQQQIVEEQLQIEGAPQNLPPPPPQQPPPQAIVVPIHAAKEGKLRAMIDKIMGKFAVGSSYHVVSEEIVTQAPPPQQQPIEQQQQQQQQLDQQDDNRERFLEHQLQLQQQQQQQKEITQQQQLSFEQQRDTTSGFGEEQQKVHARPLAQQQEELREQQQQQREEQLPQQQQQVSIKQYEEHSSLQTSAEQLDLARQPAKGQQQSILIQRQPEQPSPAKARVHAGQQSLNLAQEPLRQEPLRQEPIKSFL